MALIVLPDHNLVRHPPIVRRGDAPLLINGCSIERRGDLMIASAYVVHQAHALEVFAFAMAPDDFARSLIAASAQFLPMLIGAGPLQ